MSTSELVAGALSAVLTGLLGWAAVSDIRSRKIPNAAVIAVIALFAVWTLAGHTTTLLSGIEAAAIGLVVGYGLYATNIMGAGDAKLFAAVALFAGLSYLPVLALATVMSGGAVALVSMVTRPRRAMVMLSMRGQGDFGRGIPYGVAIAFGGAFVQWGRLLHLVAPPSLG